MTCNICNNKLEKNITVKDYFLTQENFSLYKCPKCHTQFTSPIPKNLDQYYDSENYLSHNTNNSINPKIILYRTIRNIMIYHKYKMLFKYLHGNTILDYGCGNGHFINYLIKMKENAWGYERNKNAIKNASPTIKNRIYNDEKITFQQNYDTITLWHVLEHIENPSSFIRNLNNHINDNGYIIIAVPNYLSKDAQHYQQFWAGYDVPRHITHFSKLGLNLLLEKHKYLLIKELPLIFDAFYVSLLSEKYKKGHFSWIKAIKNGYLSNLKASKNKEYSSNIFIYQKID